MCVLIINKIQMLAKYVVSIWQSMSIDSKSKIFIEFCLKRWPRFDDIARKSIVLVELYPVDQTVLAFSYFSNILAEKYQSKIISFSLSDRNNYLFYWRYRRIFEIYRSFNAKSHFNTKISRHASNKEMSIFDDLVLGIKSKNDVLNISINGDLVGNEIYEAYLIEKRKPTIDIYSVEFRAFLLQCIKTYVFWDDYFNRYDVKGVLLSHGIYRYGIIKTIANRKGISVYLPTVRSLYCLKKPNEWGVPRYDLYPELFKSFPQEIRNNGIAWAKERLKLRLSGEVGVDMSYSTKSAFRRDLSSSKVLRESGRIKVLIATHCFFDNPNAYGRNLFPDFYEWIDFLGEMSEITDYDWYLKTHPDMMPGNDEVLSDLLNKYKNITHLPSETSHLQLVEEGVSFVLTVYGSVGHECPLLGQTVINAGGKNPHIGYEFNIHVKSIQEYRGYLLNLEKINHKVDKEKIYEFYFMHYKYSGYSQLFFKSFDEYISKYSVDEQNSSIAYEYFLKNTREYDDAILCNKIYGFIESGDYKYSENKMDPNLH
jgi:hypothetical protein